MTLAFDSSMMAVVSFYQPFVGALPLANTQELVHKVLLFTFSLCWIRLSWVL